VLRYDRAVEASPDPSGCSFWGTARELFLEWWLVFLNLLQDNYVLPRFGQVMQAAGRVKRKFAMKALPDGQPFFLFGLCD
jgi:hypothetical protein